MTASQSRLGPAWVVWFAGVSAALHVGKLPPAVPTRQEALGVTQVQAGFLLSLVQLGSMVLGLLAGLGAERLGLRRCMLVGAVAGFGRQPGGRVGSGHRHAAFPACARGDGRADDHHTGAGPDPPRGVSRPPDPNAGRVGRVHAVGHVPGAAHRPFRHRHGGLAGLVVVQGCRFRCHGLVALWLRVPPDPLPAPNLQGAEPAWLTLQSRTLRASGPWLGALIFAVYSAPWLAVIGFLLTLYAQAGWSGPMAGVLTASVAVSNMAGTIGARRLLHHGMRPRALMWIGFSAMAAGAWLAFSTTTAAAPVLRYLGAMLFSVFGGLVPGSLFALVPRLAPDDRTISTTVGWMLQWAAVGQMCGPPLVDGTGLGRSRGCSAPWELHCRGASTAGSHDL